MIKDKKSFIDEGKFYRGNTHTHTTHSDGRADFEDRIKDYKENGYNFLVLSDHEYFSNFKGYDTDEFILIPGIEVEGPPYENENPFGYHTVGVGLPGKKLPESGKITWPAGTTQDDELKYLADNNCLAISAHPEWLAYSQEYILGQLDKGCIGLEIFNSICQFGFGTGFSESYVDYAMKKDRYPLIFAADDYHGPAFSSVRDHFTGYIKVKAKALTHEEIIKSILAGSFYASFDGPEIYNFEIKDGKAIVDCAPAFQIILKSPRTFGAVRTDYNEGATHAEFNLSGHEKSIRAEVVSKDFRKSWTQILKVENE